MNVYISPRPPTAAPRPSPTPTPAMATPFLPDDDLLARAALLRAAGADWDAVAADLDVDDDRVRKAVADNHPAWRRLLARARDDVVADGFAEAVHCFRKQLRSREEKTVREAAGWFFRLWMAGMRHGPRPRLPRKPDPNTP